MDCMRGAAAYPELMYNRIMPDIGKLLVIVGLMIAAAGLLIWSGVGRGWFGQLPGDIHVNRGNMSFHFPIVTCLIVSAVLTVLMWLFRR